MSEGAAASGSNWSSVLTFKDSGDGLRDGAVSGPVKGAASDKQIPGAREAISTQICLEKKTVVKFNSQYGQASIETPVYIGTYNKWNKTLQGNQVEQGNSAESMFDSYAQTGKMLEKAEKQVESMPPKISQHRDSMWGFRPNSSKREFKFQLPKNLVHH
ncbi:hypothetical protein B0H14DRAFT_2645567 [Mycena olivaceomarginata]|nr:hypothetical protein B0H14DRAFT_2645567 [Mycena olivaceomarginata]